MTGFWQRMGARATGAEQSLHARPPQPFEPAASVRPALAALGGLSALAPQHAEAPAGGLATELAGADRLLHADDDPLRERPDLRAGGDAVVPARPDAQGGSTAPARGARADDGRARASHPAPPPPGAGPGTAPSTAPAAGATSPAPTPPATTTRHPSSARDVGPSGRPPVPGTRSGDATEPTPPRLRHGTSGAAAARDEPGAAGTGRSDGRPPRRAHSPTAGAAPRAAAEWSAAVGPREAPEPSGTTVTPEGYLRRTGPAGPGRVDVEALLREQVMGVLRSRGAVGVHERAVVRDARDASPATPPAPGTAVLRAGPATVEEVRGPGAPRPTLPARASSAGAAGTREIPAATGPPQVNVRIDRVVVTRAPAPPPPPRPTRRTTVDHEAYLARRREQR